MLAEGRIDCSVCMGLCRCQVCKIYSIAHLLNYIKKNIFLLFENIIISTFAFINI